MFETLRSVLRFRRFEPNGNKRRLVATANVDDLRRVAKRRLPAGVFDYIDGGAEDETALANNVAAYNRIGFVPRILRDVSEIDTSGSIFGRPLPFPAVLAPTGFTRIAHPQGELAVARACARAGIPYTLSTMGTRSIEELAAASDSVTWGADGDRRLWFQVYLWKDRGLVRELVERAADAKYEALMLTVDTAMLGRRERDVRRGMELPPKLGLGTLVDGVRHPSWTASFLRNEPIVFANVATSKAAQSIPDGTSAVNLAAHINTQFDPSMTWEDVAWLRSIWDGKIMLKGVQSVADAELAVAHGLDAVGLSNHGGRQLDHAPAPIDLVAPTRDAVGDSIEITTDGGVRRGSDIVKAVALGADAVLLARPYLYALGAAGEPGVDWLLEFIRSGIHQTMALCGQTTTEGLSKKHLSGV